MSKIIRESDKCPMKTRRQEDEGEEVEDGGLFYLFIYKDFFDVNHFF